MGRGGVRWSVVLTLLAVLAGATGVALSAESALSTIGPAQLPPSTSADLLGPITETGRAGWNCVPEHRARARTAAAAGLPADAP